MTRTGQQPRRTRLSSQERRESILAAATEVFAESGYQRGTVGAVAAKVGVTEPVVFQNFGTKSALFAAVLDQAAQRISADLAEVVAHGRPVSELLREFLSPDHLARLHARGSLGALFSDALGLTADTAIQTAARQAVRRVADTLADLLRQGAAAGDVNPRLDPEAAAWHLLSLITTRGFRTALAPDPDALEGKLAALTHHLLTGSG